MKESYIQPKTLTVYCSCELLFQTTRWWRFTSQHWVDWSRVWTDGFLHLALYRKKCRILYFMLTEGSRFSHYLCITITMIQFAINWGISPFTVKEGKCHREALNQAAPMREHRKSLRLFFPVRNWKDPNEEHNVPWRKLKHLHFYVERFLKMGPCSQCCEIASWRCTHYFSFLLCWTQQSKVIKTLSERW